MYILISCKQENVVQPVPAALEAPAEAEHVIPRGEPFDIAQS